MTVTEELMARRRERVLEAAIGLLEHSPYESITIRVLAEASGLSAPTLYNHFSSKDEILAEAVTLRFRRIFGDPDGAGRARGLDRVFRLMEGVSASMAQHRLYSKNLRKVFRGAKATRALSEEMTLEFEVALADALGEMKAAGQIDPEFDSRVLAERLTAYANMNFLDWTVGRLSGEAIRHANIYGACLMLHGAADPETAAMLRARALAIQSRVVASPRTTTDQASAVGE